MATRLHKALGLRRRGKPAAPLIARNSRNVYHDQALAQLASVYESLQLGDSRAAVDQVKELGERIFGHDRFDRAVRHSRLSGTTA